MRPPVLPSGNRTLLPPSLSGIRWCFNEAAGFTQRKRAPLGTVPAAQVACFNEAAGFTQRKPDFTYRPYSDELDASMRPPVLPSGNRAAGATRCYAGPHRFNEAAGFTQRKLMPTDLLPALAEIASMRPPVLPSGNTVAPVPLSKLLVASMRPPVLPSGNDVYDEYEFDVDVRASMRPPVLPSGNTVFDDI